MTILAKINAKSLELRKDRSPLAGTLSTLKGAIETEAKKRPGGTELSDAEVVAVLKKFIKGIDENIAIYTERNVEDALIASQAERALLETFLPQQMNDDDLRAFIAAKIADGADLKRIMSELKSEKAGLYDGKRASEITKELLS